VCLAVAQHQQECRLDETLDPGVDLPGPGLGEPPAPRASTGVVVRSESTSSSHALCLLDKHTYVKYTESTTLHTGRSGGRLAVVSRDEPDGVHAVLARVGLVDVSRIALGADGAGPLWLVRAGRRD
jgi:hypothetical protein